MFIVYTDFREPKPVLVPVRRTPLQPNPIGLKVPLYLDLSHTSVIWITRAMYGQVQCHGPNLGQSCADTQDAVSIQAATAVISMQVVSAGGAPTQDVLFGFAVQGG